MSLGLHVGICTPSEQEPKSESSAPNVAAFRARSLSVKYTSLQRITSLPSSSNGRTTASCHSEQRILQALRTSVPVQAALVLRGDQRLLLQRGCVPEEKVLLCNRFLVCVQMFLAPLLFITTLFVFCYVLAGAGREKSVRGSS